MGDCVIIGIAGGTASGKTTVASKLKKEFGHNVELICHDSYYLAHDNMTMEERARINYDHPDAFENERLIADLKNLKAGNEVEVPVYDFTVHNRKPETVTALPKEVIIVEGILVFENEELRNLMDIKIFVDTDADVRLVRRVLRDVRERGRTLESVLNQYITTVKPMHDQFIEPSKKYADIIIPKGGENEVAIRMVTDRIYSIINKNLFTAEKA